MRVKRSPLPLLAAALSLALLGSACATRPPADDPDAIAEFKQNNDPIEPFTVQRVGVLVGDDEQSSVESRPVERGR